MIERTVRFEHLGMHDVARVGGKNASLGEMIRGLASAQVRVPDGFATTADAYREFLAHQGLAARIDARLRPRDQAVAGDARADGADRKHRRGRLQADVRRS